jgi:hypothetical protein
MKRLITLLIAGLAFIALGCAMETQAAGDVGSISVDLTIAAGYEIEEVDWELTNGVFTESGVIDISAPGSTASIEVFGVPAGDGYVMEMQATSTNGAATCLGSASLDVDIGVVAEVDVLLNCKLPQALGGVRANGRFNVCADLAQVVVSPLQTSVGNDIEVESVAVDEEGDPIAWQWTASAGSFGDPNAPSTTYTCEQVGNAEITIEVSDDGFEACVDSWTINVTCVA